MNEEQQLPEEASAADGHTTASSASTTQADADDGGATQTGLSRRRFLRRLAVTAAGLAAAACGRGAPSPTPTAALPTATSTPIGLSSLLPRMGSARYKAYMPLIQNEEAAQVAVTQITAQATPTAPLSPDPTVTPTPKPPTATPTPQATPFPPGQPSKLGLFVARNHPQIFEVLSSQGVAVVKTLELDTNFAAQIKQTSPHTLLIGRIDLPQVGLSNLDPIVAAQDFVNKLMPIAGDPARRESFDGWEAYNEPVASNADEMKRLADFEAERTRLLAAQGIRSVIGNFGTGQPPLELWEQFLPAVQAAKENNGWLGLHEYSAPTMYYLTTRENQGRYPGVGPEDTGWLTLRYRKVYNEILIPAGLEIPLVFTELGVDGLVTNRPGPTDARGWQDFQRYWAENGYGLWGPGAYVEQLVWYDEAMRQDGYVLGGCIYAMAASQGWESYDILGPAAAVLQQYLSVHASA